ncbi:MAG: S26 family signal peptidase [Alphaproteobacteria bacterium]|nr:S26 family signal peptidase [Alphaproteobacteria bacterium]
MTPLRLAAASGVALVALGSGAILRPMPLLVWNASASAPLGFYVVRPATGLRRDDIVLAWPPKWAANLAARRGYLPLGVPLVKHIAALSGDRVCEWRQALSINGRIVAQGLAADREGRVLPHWRGCLRLKPGEAFLLMAQVPDSFDGRYFGPIRRFAVIGKLRPLWTW